MALEIQIRTFPEIKEQYKITLEMSRNAMYGFAAHCKYQSVIQSGAHDYHWHIDPLGHILGYKNQVFGFYLTPASPDLVIGFKRDLEVMDNNMSVDDINSIEMFYEKDYDNIISIMIASKDDEKLERPISTLELTFTRKGLLNLSEILVKLADDFSCENSFELNIANDNEFYSLEIKSKRLGVLYDYDSTLQKPSLF